MSPTNETPYNRQPVVNYPGVSAGMDFPPPTPVDNGDGTITIPDGVGKFFDNEDKSGNTVKHTILGDVFTPLGGVNYIVGDRNGGDALYTMIQDRTLINESNIIPVVTVVLDDQGVLNFTSWDSQGEGQSNKTHNRFATDPLLRIGYASGLDLTEDGARQMALTAGLIYVTNTPHDLVACDTSLATLDNTGPNLFYKYYLNGSLEWVSELVNGYSNVEINPLTGGLVALGVAKYTPVTFFRTIDPRARLGYVLGTTAFNSIQGAFDAALRRDLPPIFQAIGFRVGKGVIGSGANTFAILPNGESSLISAFDVFN